MFSSQAVPSNFLNKIQRIKVLLYHSLHQTTVYSDWLNTYVTSKQKHDLDNLSHAIIGSLTTQMMKVKPSHSEVDYYYRSPRFLLDLSLPLPEACHVNLAAIYQATPEIVRAVAEFDKLLVSNKVVKSSLMGQQAMTKLIKSNELIEDTSINWQHKLNQINSILYELNAVLRDLDKYFRKGNRADMIVVVQGMASKLEAFITRKIEAFLMLDNLATINHWSGLIDKIAIGDSSEYAIETNLNSLLNKSDIYKVITESFNRLMSHNHNFEFYLKCMLCNHGDGVKIASFSINLFPEINLLMIEARAFRASSIFQLARLIEKGSGCCQNNALACDYFELAFIYSDHHKERSLALYKLKKSYYQSLIDSGSKVTLDSVDISLQQLKHYLRQPWMEFNPDINTKRIVLDLITCRSVKIQIDYLHNTMSDEIPNSNMISLLYLLEQYNFTNILHYHLKIKKTLQPIDDLFMTDSLSRYDKEIFEKIREICQFNHSTPYRMHTP